MSQHHHYPHRILGHIAGKNPGPTLIIIGGLHGNEPAGPAAMQQLINIVEARKDDLQGNVIAMLGNKNALERGERYLSADLNRLWTPNNIELCRSGTFDPNQCAEYTEMAELLAAIDQITSVAKGSIYCIDLHSTSAPTPPFAPLNDQLRNRDFVAKFPIPVILGIEEFVNGTLLSYFNEREIIAVGFEAGQHDAPETQMLHLDFCLMALTITQNFSQETLPEATLAAQHLQQHGGGAMFYDIRYLHKIAPTERFKMKPGFRSFQDITYQQHVADNQHGPILAPSSGTMFMPLYQNLGSEGFFLIKRISLFWLWASRWARQLRLEWLLIMLPGVRRHPEYAHTLNVDRYIAKFLAVKVFHLLGYRRHWQDKNGWIFTRREL